MFKSNFILIAVLLVPLSLFSQRLQKFPRQIPAGNYSGICAIGGDCYAVVSDKSEKDGFFVFRMPIDTVKGKIISAENLGFRSSGLPNRDMEAICYRPSTNTLFISGEKDNEVYEYTLDGKRTGRRLAMPEAFRKADSNYGLESLTYDTRRHLFFTTTEHPLKGDTLLRIQAFDDNMQPVRQYLYRPDVPVEKAYLYGVSELCALDDGRLLVIEREIRIPKLKIGATSKVRIYVVNIDEADATPEELYRHSVLKKALFMEKSTALTVVKRNFSNIEGLCEPFPGFLLMVADSQNQYKGLLRDWFITKRKENKSR